jgi:hypothetical protein
VSTGEIREDFIRERFGESARQLRLERWHANRVDNFEDLFLEVIAHRRRIRRRVDDLEFIFLGEAVKFR